MLLGTQTILLGIILSFSSQNKNLSVEAVALLGGRVLAFYTWCPRFNPSADKRESFSVTIPNSYRLFIFFIFALDEKKS